MRIYTRTGDDGTTGLLGRDRVPKHDLRVEAYGSVDELNAVLGVVRAQDTERWFEDLLPGIQAALFRVGAELATVDEKMLQKLDRVADTDIEQSERAIDRMEADLAPLTRFVIPAGTSLAAHLHLARTVCRRAERRVTALASRESIEPRIVRYLNRLADLLFVMARWSNHRAGAPEVTWPV